MSNSSQQNHLSLYDVLSVLMTNNPAEYHEVRFVARKLVAYYKRPPHEIQVASTRYELRFFSLYLSYERLPLYLIEILLRDADRLISNAEKIWRMRLKEMTTVNRPMDREAKDCSHSNRPLQGARKIAVPASGTVSFNTSRLCNAAQESEA